MSGEKKVFDRKLKQWEMLSFWFDRYNCVFANLSYGIHTLELINNFVISGNEVLITGAGGRWWDNRTNQGKALFYRGFESFGFAIN